MNIIQYSLGSGAFLRDSQTCANLEGFHIWVGFHVTYENGSYVSRHGHTPLPDRFTDAEGLCAHHEICIIVTDHRTARPVPRHQGVVAEVVACKTKSSKAEAFINGSKLMLNFSDICRLTKPD